MCASRTERHTPCRAPAIDRELVAWSSQWLEGPATAACASAEPDCDGGMPNNRLHCAADPHPVQRLLRPMPRKSDGSGTSPSFYTAVPEQTYHAPGSKRALSAESPARERVFKRGPLYNRFPPDQLRPWCTLRRGLCAGTGLAPATSALSRGVPCRTAPSLVAASACLFVRF